MTSPFLSSVKNNVILRKIDIIPGEAIDLIDSRHGFLDGDQVVEGPYGRRKRLMKSLCGKAEVKEFQFHALRHSGASLMENADVSVGAIQTILGHYQRRTTEIYLHNLGDLERQAMAVFEQVSRKR